MSLFDKAKEAYKKQQEKQAELNEIRGSKLATQTVEYMGGYGDRRKATGVLSFYENQVEFKVTLNARSSFAIPNENISDIAIEGKDEVSRRVTVTRLLTLGIFAFALKKKSKDKEAFVTVSLVNDQEAIFHVNDKSPMELKARLSKAVSLVKQNTPMQSEIGVPISTADELTKLAKLKENGILTSKEFDKMKTELLS